MHHERTTWTGGQERRRRDFDDQPGRIGSRFLLVLTSIGALVAAVVLTACGSLIGQTPNASDDKYLDDLNKHGIPTTDIAENTRTELGHGVCDEVANGTPASVKVLQIANLQFSRTTVFTFQQSETLVYWAVADLCPQQISQVQDRWRNGE